MSTQQLKKAKKGDSQPSKPQKGSSQPAAQQFASKTKSSAAVPKSSSGSVPRVRDDRFSHAEFDPRFSRMPQKLTKTKVDDRFKRMFTDKEFNHVAKVD